MNGAHDLGGMHGLGPVNPEPETTEPVFHHEWERRAFALTLACGFLGHWNLDESRHARERQHPVDYLRHGYYENWLAGLETLLVEKGLVGPDELDGQAADGPAPVPAPAVPARRVGEILARGGPVDMPADRLPAFAVGDPVRVLNNHPLEHTRAPRYVRGCRGEVAAHHGCHVLPDANARGERIGAHLYSVRFEAAELWGMDGACEDAVYVDLWEPYLERAG